MPFKLGKRGYYLHPEGTLKFRTPLPKGVKELCDQYEATKNLSPVEIAQLEYRKSPGSMKEFIQNRSKKKWKMP